MPSPSASWPPGLEREVASLDDAKTKDLPTLACLAIGAPVVVHMKKRYVLVSVSNNSDGIIQGVVLDHREEYLRHNNTGYSVVHLRYPPIKVFVYIKSADDAGLKLPGLARGVIAVAPIERTFTIEGRNKRNFTIKRRQLPLTAGGLSSVYRSQGQTLK